MENLPWYIYATFIFAFILALSLFIRATHYSKPFIIICAIWIVIQSALGVRGFYNDVSTMTLKFPLLVLPPLVLIILQFITKSGKTFIDSLDIKVLTILHSFRILIEIVLFWLFVRHAVPEAMTFEGRNFDILSGLTAPLIYYFGFVRKKLSNTLIIGWNVACIALLLNVVSNAILSLPGRFEQFGFEQPNIAVGYFPILLLPTLLVPIALFSNAAAIRQLLIMPDRLRS